MANNDLMLDVNLAAELKMAFRRSGFTTANIKQLSEGDILTDIRRVLIGTACFQHLDHVLPLDEPPIFIPEDAEVVEHQLGQPMNWDPNNFEFWYAKKQAQGERVTGPDLQEEMRATKRVPLNANALDFLLGHRHCIPREWQQKNVFFWGTIYRFKNTDKFFVRCLSYYSGVWTESARDITQHYQSTGWRSKGSPALVHVE